MQIELLTGLVNVAIPTVYQKGMSYYETLTAVVNKVNELISEMNLYFGEDILVHVEAIMQQWLADGTVQTIADDLLANIGDRQYTEQNYVTNGETVTASIDALDVGTASQLEDIAINIQPSGGDDTIAFKDAVSKISSVGSGSIILKPYGSYMLSEQILLPSDIKILGNNATISINPLNWNNEIPHFYGLFTTVNIPDRPMDIYWRLGAGVITHRNIVIENITFQLNRDAATVSTSDMLVADFSVIRYEDAENCVLRNCSFIDKMSIANHNGSHIVWASRSNYCTYENNYFENCTPFEIAESVACTVKNNIIRGSGGTAVETVHGERHLIDNNDIDTCWWDISVIGINSLRCTVSNNRIGVSKLTGITFGHDDTGIPEGYNLLPRTDYSICINNTIENGDTTSTVGYIGILVQNGSHLRIEKNNILSLRKGTTFTDLQGGVVVNGGSSVTRFTSITVKDNYIYNATNGVRFNDGEDVKIKDNFLDNCIIGIYVAINSARQVILGNTIKNCDRSMTISNGYAEIKENKMINITVANTGLSNGYFDYSDNYHEECAEFTFSSIKKLTFSDNVFINTVTISRAGQIYNANTAGTATIDKISIYGNVHPGTTDLLFLNQVLNQTNRNIETTTPTIYRATSYNIGNLPTSITGLATGDLWNDSGTVKVV